MNEIEFRRCSLPSGACCGDRELKKAHGGRSHEGF